MVVKLAPWKPLHRRHRKVPAASALAPVACHRLPHRASVGRRPGSPRRSTGEKSDPTGAWLMMPWLIAPSFLRRQMNLTNAGADDHELCHARMISTLIGRR
jgi:hypothetical protein